MILLTLLLIFALVITSGVVGAVLDDKRLLDPPGFWLLGYVTGLVLGVAVVFIGMSNVN